MEKTMGSEGHFLFAPEPTDLADMIWLDAQRGEYKVHLLYLAVKSRVFRAIFDCKPTEPLQRSENREVLLAFFTLAYDYDSPVWPVNAEDFCGLWKLLHAYELREKPLRHRLYTVVNDLPLIDIATLLLTACELQSSKMERFLVQHLLRETPIHEAIRLPPNILDMLPRSSLRLLLAEQNTCAVTDKENNCFESTIVERTDVMVLIRFRGWNSKYDEWIARNSPRIERLAKRRRVSLLSNYKYLLK